MDGAFSCFPGLGGSHRENRHEEKQQQMHGECGREKVVCGRETAKRRVEVEDGRAAAMEDCDHYHYHYNSDDDDEEEAEERQDEAPSLILQDCAPQHCTHVGAPGTSSPRPISPSQPRRGDSRSPSPCPQPSSALRHHHNHCRPHTINDRPSDPDSCNFRWDIALLRALRKDPVSNARETGKKRQPGRVDMNFTPKKGDLIIHLDRKQWRRVLEFYDPSFQRLHDGDILIRIRIDSYSCLGIILMKGTGYMYHRGYWMFLGTDSDQISQCLRGGG